MQNQQQTGEGDASDGRTASFEVLRYRTVSYNKFFSGCQQQVPLKSPNTCNN